MAGMSPSRHGYFYLVFVKSTPDTANSTPFTIPLTAVGKLWDVRLLRGQGTRGHRIGGRLFCSRKFWGIRGCRGVFSRMRSKGVRELGEDCRVRRTHRPKVDSADHTDSWTFGVWDLAHGHDGASMHSYFTGWEGNSGTSRFAVGMGKGMSVTSMAITPDRGRPLS